MAQVMKKICHDKSLGVSVHVAMDSGIENKYVTIFRYHFKGVAISGSFTFVAVAKKPYLKIPTWLIQSGFSLQLQK